MLGTWLTISTPSTNTALRIRAGLSAQVKWTGAVSELSFLQLGEPRCGQKSDGRVWSRRWKRIKKTVQDRTLFSRDEDDDSDIDDGDKIKGYDNGGNDNIDSYNGKRH